MGALNIAQLSDWVGMQASAEMPVIFDGSPVTITTEGSALADKAELVVTDTQGHVVQRLPIDPAQQVLDWRGISASGARLPPGSYTLSVESFSGDEKVATNPVLVHARVIEARNETGSPVLVMEGGQKVKASDVVGLRQPS